jgi:hypothetical protein
MNYFNRLTGGLAVVAAAAIISLTGCSKEAATPQAPAATNATADASLPAGTKPDLLATCPVSGEKLGGDMGKPVIFAYQGQEIKLCCGMCKPKFDADPAPYLKKIQDAATAKN